MAPETLTPMSFASHPVVVKVGGEYYCRSIQKMNPDGSLSFFCAIDDGVVLSIAQPMGMVESTRAALKDVDARLGGIDMISASTACCAGSTRATGRCSATFPSSTAPTG